MNLSLTLKKKYLLCLTILVLTVSIANAAAIDSLIAGSTREIVMAVQQKYAPDKRVNVFNVSVQSRSPLVLNVETTAKDAVKELKALLAAQKEPVTVNEQSLPSAELGDEVYGVANLSDCNGRSSSTNAAEMLSQTLLGTAVRVLKKEKGYYLIRTPDNYLFWTDAAGIALMNEVDFKKWQSSLKIVFTAEYGHAFEKSSKKSLPVSDLVAGNILICTAKEKRFYKVAFPDGRIAFVPVKEAMPYSNWVSRPTPTAGQIIKTAKTLLGVPYLWGGTSIKGVDCSGFTKTCYYLNGIVLPRDASQQALVGQNVDIYEGDTLSMSKCVQNLKTGDLLFFTSLKNTGKVRKVIHTAIYIGDGEFIQASGMVRINNLVPGKADYDSYRSKTLIGARRMLTEVGQPEITRIDQHPYYTSQLK